MCVLVQGGKELWTCNGTQQAFFYNKKRPQVLNVVKHIVHLVYTAFSLGRIGLVHWF